VLKIVSLGGETRYSSLGLSEVLCNFQRHGQKVTQNIRVDLGLIERQT